MINFNKEIFKINNIVFLYKDLLKNYKNNKYSRLECILIHKIIFRIAKSKLKFLDNIEYDKISNNFFDYEYDMRLKINKEEFLEIRKTLIEIGKYKTIDFLETFIDGRKKNENNGLYFEDIVPEFYEDFKKYIIEKYKMYDNESLIIRDISVDLNDYLLPILGKELTKKLFDEIELKSERVRKEVYEFIERGGYKDS